VRIRSDGIVCGFYRHNTTHHTHTLSVATGVIVGVFLVEPKNANTINHARPTQRRTKGLLFVRCGTH